VIQVDYLLIDDEAYSVMAAADGSEVFAQTDRRTHRKDLRDGQLDVLATVLATVLVNVG
jgi:hypothetical protein